MMVIFLVGLVSMILMRTLRKDYARYSKEDDLDDMVRHYYVNTVVFHNLDIYLHYDKLYILYNVVCLYIIHVKYHRYSGQCSYTR